MTRVSLRTLSLAALLAIVPVPLSAQGNFRVAGYWEGKGTTWERPLDDPIRKLTRRSETEFWFTCDSNGSCKGEATATYSAELEAVKWTIPVPTFGSIDASVSGSSEKVRLVFPIEGTVESGKVQLQATGQSADMVVPNSSFDFLLSAKVNLPSMMGAPAASPQIQVIHIPAKAWSPFQGLTAQVTRRPHGPFVAGVERKGEKFGIEWHVQKNPSYDPDELVAELLVVLEPRLLVDLEARLEASLLAKLEPKIEVDLEPKLEVSLAPKLEVALGPKLELDLGPKLEATLAPKLEVVLAPKLEATLAPKLELTLKPKLEATLKADLEVTLEQEIRATLQAWLQQYVQSLLVLIQQNIQNLQTTEGRQNERIAALEAATLKINIRDRATDKPAPLSTVEITGSAQPVGGGNTGFVVAPSTEDGVLELRLPKGRYTVKARSGGREASQVVDLHNDAELTLHL